MSEADHAESALEAATRRLDRAIGGLEQRLAARMSTLQSEPGLFDHDRAELASQLDAARAREKALESVAAEASAALGRAAAEVRAALQAEA